MLFGDNDCPNPYALASPSSVAEGPKNGVGRRLMWLSLGVATVSNSCAVGTMCTLIGVEAGRTIFPLGHGMLILAFSAAGLFVGAPMALVACFFARGWWRALSLLIAVANLLPMPLGGWAMNLVARLGGFTID